MTSEGRLVVKNAAYAEDLHHLITIVIATLAVIIHVLTFVTCLKLMKRSSFDKLPQPLLPCKLDEKSSSSNHGYNLLEFREDFFNVMVTTASDRNF